MAEVDTSIYKSTVPPLDPLKMYGQVVGIQNQQGQNRLLQQQQDLRQGMTEAYQQAYDPATKQVDVNKLGQIITQDPRTGWNSGDVLSQAYGNQTAQANAQQDQLKSLIAHTQMINAAGTSLIANKGLGVAPMHDQIAQAITSISNHGDSLMTGKIAKDTIDSIPGDDNPRAQLQWVQQKMAENDAYAGKFTDTYNRTFGNKGTVNSGQQTVGITQDQRTGAITSPASQNGVQMTTGPEFNADLKKITVPEIDPATGQPKLGADGKPTGLTQDIYVPRLTLPGASGVAGGGATAPKPLAPQQTNRLVKPATPPASAPPAVAPPIMAGPPPGVNSQLLLDQTQYNTDLGAVSGHAQNVQSLDKALHALELTRGGKSTEATHAMYSFLNTQLPDLMRTQHLQDDVKNYDLFKKYTTKYAADSAAGGGSTDLGREMSSASNAGTAISTDASRAVLQDNIGRENQAAAIALESQAKDRTGSGHIGRSAQLANDTTRIAFAWDRYNPDEQKAILDQLQKTGGMAKFNKSLELAHKHRLIAGPGQ